MNSSIFSLPVLLSLGAFAMLSLIALRLGVRGFWLLGILGLTTLIGVGLAEISQANPFVTEDRTPLSEGVALGLRGGATVGAIAMIVAVAATGLRRVLLGRSGGRS